MPVSNQTCQRIYRRRGKFIVIQREKEYFEDNVITKASTKKPIRRIIRTRFFFRAKEYTNEYIVIYIGTEPKNIIPVKAKNASDAKAQTLFGKMSVNKENRFEEAR